MQTFVKFPHTPHLAVLPGVAVREDKVMSAQERGAFLCHTLIVEEKIDGANLGISFDSNGNIRAQNRGGYLQEPCDGQWKKLKEWLEVRSDTFFDILSETYILFGEWCYAKHSVAYTKLPDWFLGFDIFDKVSGRFFNFQKRNEIFHKLGVSSVPYLRAGIFSLPELENMFMRSAFGDELMEGLYLRYDHCEWLKARCKLVRTSFIQSVQKHWIRSAIVPNRISAMDS